MKATPAEKETIIKNRYTKSTLKNIEGVCSRWTELFGSSVCVDSFNDENIYRADLRSLEDSSQQRSSFSVPDVLQV